MCLGRRKSPSEEKQESQGGGNLTMTRRRRRRGNGTSEEDVVSTEMRRFHDWAIDLMQLNDFTVQLYFPFMFNVQTFLGSDGTCGKGIACDRICAYETALETAAVGKGGRPAAHIRAPDTE